MKSMTLEELENIATGPKDLMVAYLEEMFEEWLDEEVKIIGISTIKEANTITVLLSNGFTYIVDNNEYPLH